MSVSNEKKMGPKASGMLALTALGVVYGDIGTSPLYVMKESLHKGHVAIEPMAIYGILSMIFWALIIVVSIKYCLLILKADNKGEGGILALTGLVTPEHEKAQWKRRYLIRLGLLGTALLYGDGMITPAISVLSAVEGLELISPTFKPYIIPITVAILVGLFSVQRYGTEKVGKAFGPIMLTWFTIIGFLGLIKVVQMPEILEAVNPYYAVHFLATHLWTGFLILGSVVLVVTGGEALYSDLGHFGKVPIQRAWFYVVLPCLLLNYFGQGVLLLKDPSATVNPFFLMAPKYLMTPFVMLAAMAAVIASQALITGIFSITAQAVQWGYFPRVLIEHTSEHEKGQIYVKMMNRVLMIACIVLVLMFKSSSNLAAAYGIAVTSTMAITSVLFYYVMTHNWRWSRFRAMTITGIFLVIDGAFLFANMLKFFEGGWVVLAVGVVVFTMMTTWKKGRRLLAQKVKKELVPLDTLIEDIRSKTPYRTPGSAIYMAGSMDYAPYSLVKTYHHFNAVHENLIFLSVITEHQPRVSKKRRVEIIKISECCHRVNIRYGYIERPNIPMEIHGLKIGKCVVNPHEATYFIGKERLFATRHQGMAIWREKLFAWMMLNAQDATTFFQLPRKQVLEVGVHIEL